MSGRLNNNFELNTRIEINRTASELDGQYGTITGIVKLNGCDFYIISLDKINSLGWTSILLIESCIDRLSNRKGQ